jgi:hypothetical protein
MDYVLDILEVDCDTTKHLPTKKYKAKDRLPYLSSDSSSDYLQGETKPKHHHDYSNVCVNQKTGWCWIGNVTGVTPAGAFKTALGE